MLETNGVPQVKKPEAAPPVPLDDPSLYINREMSWLEFNRRVLDEALYPAVPLMEYVKPEPVPPPPATLYQSMENCCANTGRQNANPSKPKEIRFFIKKLCLRKQLA